MTQKEIAALRLTSQRIADNKFKTVADTVRFFGAMQAQEYLMSLWAIGLRMYDGATDDVVEDAIRNREIVRTWPMRGTLHYVAPEDAKWMLDLLTPRVISSQASLFRAANLTEADLETSREVAIRVLEGGTILSRPAFYAAMSEHGIDMKGYRGIHTSTWLAQKGVICFGPREGKQFTYTLLDEWAPNQRQLAPQEALGELAQRYFTSHGPATLKDFMWWSGLRVKEVQIGLELSKHQLQNEVVDGEEYWFARNLPRGKTDGAYLLPIFDEQSVAYKNRQAINYRTPELSQAELVGGNNIILDSQFVGRWMRTIKKDGLFISLQPYVELTASDQEVISDAAQRYAKFCKLPCHIDFLSV